MKPISPWSVKGVDDDARELARNAAQAAGLTLGAWIDRAIRKSTGLAPAALKFVPSTTARTTFFQGSPEDRGETPEGAEQMTPYSEGSLDDRGKNFEVAGQATPDTQDRQVEPGNGEAPATEIESGEPDPEHASTPHGLQVDPEERFAATVETVATPRPRRWPSVTGLTGAGVPRIALAAAAVVVGAGVLVWGVGFTGSDDRDPSASTTEGLVASATATPAPPTPERAHRDDAPPPSEPGVIEMLTAAAEQGDAIAQHDLAARYLDGRTVARDLDLAIKWLQRAASQGMASAQHRLAVMYDDGTGVKADRNRAAMWHTRAASQGHPGSQHALALAYAAGHGVKPSEASAIVWLKRAARAGNVASQVLLAERYETGSGVARNADKATEWYASAAAKGHPGAAARAKKLASAAEAKPVAAAQTTPSAPPALPPATPAPTADGPLDKAGIAEVQLLLARLAFKPGPADGILGRRTVGEIKLYQGFAGLSDDGKATVSLLRELREMVRGMSTATSPPR